MFIWQIDRKILKEGTYMKSTSDNMNSSVLHEEIVMPNADLPINFIEHHHGAVGPFCILHWHSEIEMVYVCKGVISANCKSGTVVASPGDLVFINSNELHDYHILEAPIELYCCTIGLPLFQGRYISSYESQFLSSNNIAVFQNHIVKDEQINRYFLTMWEEGRTQEKGYEYAIKSNLYGILSLMVRYHIQSTMSNKQYLYKKRNLDSINKVIHYIEEHYQTDISLNELAALLNVNRFYFCRFFKDVTGSTPIEYLNNFRTHQAVSLMREQPGYTITQVATLVGYNDSSYFARVFKTVMGESPSVYKARIDKELETADATDETMLVE